MFKKNLFAIAIVTLGLVMTVSTFGQDRPPVSKKDKPKRSDAQIKLMYVANQEEYIAGGIADVRGGTKDKKEETARIKPNSGFVSPSSIKVPQPKGMNKADLTEQLSISSPRDVASEQAAGKRQHKPIQAQDKLGNFEIQDIKSPSDTTCGQVTGKRQQTQEKLGNFEIQMAKKPTANLGDTGTHEVGHKQRNARKN